MDTELAKFLEGVSSALLLEGTLLVSLGFGAGLTSDAAMLTVGFGSMLSGLVIGVIVLVKNGGI